MKRSVWKNLLALLAVSLLAACLCAMALAEGELELWGEIECDPYVIAGQPLEITLPEAEGAASYQIAFMDLSNNGWTARNMIQGNYEAGEVPLSTDGISAGLWPVRAWVSDAQGDKIYWERVIYVTASAPSATNVTFVVARGNTPVSTTTVTAQVNEDCLAWVYAPGATGISLDFGGKGTWHDSTEWLSGCFGYNAFEDQFTLDATAYYADGSSKRKGKSFALTQDGEMPDWQPSIPDTIGEDGLNVTFDRIDLGDANVEYEVRVWDLEDDGRQVKYQFYRNVVDEGAAGMANMAVMADDTQTFSLPASALVPGHSYRVWMRAKAVGRRSDGCFAEKTVPYPDARPAEELLTATVWRDDTEYNYTDLLEVATHEKWYLRLELPEGTTAARIFYGDHFEMLSDREGWSECLEQGYWARRMEDGWPGSYRLYAQLYTGEVDEDTDLWELDWEHATVTNAIPVVVEKSLSTCDRAPLIVPTKVQRGDPLVFTIQNWQGNCGALWYSVSKAGGSEYEGYMVYNPSGTGAYPTADLEPGLYILWVNSVSPYTGVDEDAAYYYFVVTDREAPEDVFISVSDNVLTGHEEAMVSAWAPGASAMRLLVKNPSEGRIEECGYWEDADCFSTGLDLSPGYWDEAGSFDASRPRGSVKYKVYAEARYGDEWRQSKHVEVTASYPEATVYELSAPMTVRAGDPYTFTVSGLYNADDYWWEVYVEKKVQTPDGMDDVTIWRCSANDRGVQSETAFSVPADLLEADGCYRLNVWADGREANGCGMYRDFYVTRASNPTDKKLRLTLEYDGIECDGSGDGLNAPVRADIHLKVTGLEGATALRWYNGREWHFYGEVEGDVAEWDDRLDTENVQYFVSACSDQIVWDEYYDQDIDWQDLDLHWGGISNIVRVNVGVDGLAAPARAECSPNGGSIDRGDPLNVTILPPAEGQANYGTEFRAYFRALDNGEDFRWAEWQGQVGDQWEDGISFTMRTAELPAGRDYALIVESCAPRYNWCEQAVYEFTVTEPELEENQMQLSVSNLEWDEEKQVDFAWAESDIEFAAYAPGASRIDVVWYLTDSKENDEAEFWPFDGEYAIDDFREGEEGFYELSAVAYDEEDSVIAISKVYAVEIRSRGDMEPATVEGATLVPAYEDYTFTVYGLNQCGDNWFDIDVNDESEEEPVEIARFDRNNWRDGGWYNEQDDSFTFTVPSSQLTAGHEYRIHTWVDQDGYHGADSDFRFLVYDERSDDVRLSVNGSETEASGMAHTDFTIEITAPGATAMRLFNGNGWDYMHDFDAEEGMLVREGYWFDKGEYELFTQACYEEVDWAAMNRGELHWEELPWGAVSANTVRVSVDEKGNALSAVLDKEAYEAERGELLRFEITGGGDVNDPGHATHFHAFIVDEYGNWDGGNDASLSVGSQDDFPLAVYLATGYLDPNESHWLIVDACAPEYAWTSLRVPLTVTEPAGGAPFIFQVQDENLYDNVDFRFSAYEADASWMEVFAHNVDDGDNHDNDERWDYQGNNVNDKKRLDEGTYELWAVAHYADEASEPRESEVLTVVVESLGNMTPATVEGETLAPAYEDYTFTVYGLNQIGNNWFDINVWDEDDSEEVARFTRNNWRKWGVYNEQDNSFTFTVPASELTAGHEYHVHMYVGQDGWHGANSDFRFMVYGERSDDVRLSVNGSETNASGMAHTDFTIEITAPGATAVRLYNGNGWDYMGDFDAEEGKLVREGYWFDKGEYTLFAQACYEEVDWAAMNRGELHWEELPWGAVSANTVRVSVDEKGDALSAVLDKEAYEVERGELLRFEITGGGDVNDPSHATHFHAFIVDEDGNWDGSNDASRSVESPDDFPLAVYLATGYLDPNESHWLIVDACAPEYAWVSLRVPLTVTEPEGEAPFVFQVEDGRFGGEDFRFSAYEPDASWMEAFAHNVNDGDNHDNDAHWEYFPGNYINGRGSLWKGEYELWAVAHYADEAREPRESEVLNVVIGARGDMTPAEVDGERLFRAGRDYGFGVEDLHQAGDNWYDICVQEDMDEDGGRGEPREIIRFTREQYGDETDWFEIPAELLVPGHRYTINVWVDAKDLYGQGSNFSFYVFADDDAYTLRLPDALTEIGEEAFAGVDARMIVVPDDVTSVGSRAFADCPNLVAVCTTVEIPQDAFDGCNWDVIVDTPAGE